MINKHPQYLWKKEKISQMYYWVKPLIPRRAQIFIRRIVIIRALPDLAHVWPINPASACPPQNWPGWPDNKKFAVILTHDVESKKGVARCRSLAELEMKLGFRSSFNFLLKKYSTPDDLRAYLLENGFEIGIHGCYHDGKKFSSFDIFKERAEIINRFLREWDAVGFRAPSMHCNLDWIRELDIEYDLSTFDTDPFEPKSQGVETIFPFRVPDSNDNKGYLELPYTLPQDFTPFILMKEKNIDIWKMKLDWIAEQGGMVLVNVHPDYMHFGIGRKRYDEYAASLYADLLTYLNETYSGQYWHALPKEVSKHY